MARERPETDADDETPDGLLLALAFAQNHVDLPDDDALAALLAEMQAGTDPAGGVHP